MKELFKKQLENDVVVTEEILDKIKIKKYKNGDDVKVGDKVLYALLTDMSEEMIKARLYSSDAPMERSQEPQPISLELITLNEGQFGLYTYDERLQDKSGLESGKGLPIIRLKQ